MTVLPLYRDPTNAAPREWLPYLLSGADLLPSLRRGQNPDDGWEEAISYLKNVKQRDFESYPFTVKSDKLGCLHIEDAPSKEVKLNGKAGAQADKDGREAEALHIIEDN